MASQKYSINEHVPTSGRAASLPERMTERIDCKTVRIFAYSSTREQSNEAENRERDWGDTRPMGV